MFVACWCLAHRCEESLHRTVCQHMLADVQVIARKHVHVRFVIEEHLSPDKRMKKTSSAQSWMAAATDIWAINEENGGSAITRWVALAMFHLCCNFGHSGRCDCDFQGRPTAV